MPYLLGSRAFWIATNLRLQFNQIGKDIRLPPQLVGNPSAAGSHSTKRR
jgi:hypothetical protein